MNEPAGAGKTKWPPRSVLAKTVEMAGFLYDPDQDIIYSRQDAWQRMTGYAYAYDFAAPLAISAVIDCEPIFFTYGGREWMIELWKGQYGLETGGEVGVYYRKLGKSSFAEELLDSTVGKRPHDPRQGKFYYCARDEDCLEMSFTLSRNGSRVFTRGPEKHWWLTGFKWGLLSRPEDLEMDLRITFPDREMTGAFAAAARSMGYGGVDLDGASAALRFSAPHAHQPRSDVPRAAEHAWKNNEALVGTYNRANLSSNDPNTIPEELARDLIDYFTQYHAYAGQAKDYAGFWGSWKGLENATFHVRHGASVSFVLDVPDRSIRSGKQTLLAFSGMEITMRFTDQGEPRPLISSRIDAPPYGLAGQVSKPLTGETVRLIDNDVYWFGSADDRKRGRNWIQGSAILRNGTELTVEGKINLYIAREEVGPAPWRYVLEDITAVVDVRLDTVKAVISFNGAVQWTYKDTKYCTGIDHTTVAGGKLEAAVEQKVKDTLEQTLKAVTWPRQPCPSIGPPAK